MSCLSQTEKYRRGATVLHQAPLCHHDTYCAPGQAESQHRRLMIAICRDPGGLCRRLSAYRVAQYQRGPAFWGISRGSSAESQGFGFGEVEVGAGSDTTWCCFHLISADRR